jgi:hypothetical protein
LLLGLTKGVCKMKLLFHFHVSKSSAIFLAIAASSLFLSSFSPSLAINPQNRTEADKVRLQFFLERVCLPYLAEGQELSRVLSFQKLHKERICSIQGCTEKLCSNQPEIGCAAVGENYCSITVKGDADFPIFETEVSRILADKGRKWRVVTGDKTRPGFETTYCNGENTLNLRTFAVSPGHAPDSIVRFVSNPEFDVTIQRNSSSWCN